MARDLYTISRDTHTFAAIRRNKQTRTSVYLFDLMLRVRWPRWSGIAEFAATGWCTPLY